jgi:alkaline phosphatase D
MPVSRRDFLLRTAGMAAMALPASRLLAQPRFATNPYTLGIASGYPTPDGVVLWTRLAPESGMPAAGIEVGWEIASDESFRKIVRRGRETAAPRWAHSVRAEVAGLEPDRWYFYRFHTGGATSPVGRTRTAPAAGAATGRLRFAYASCQQYEQGHYVAYRHMAAEDLDLVVHLGDYIYESSWGRAHVRKHDAGEPITLEEYRNRYALYKSDANLQAAHAAFPWMVTWDDHEVDNDYASDHSQDRDLPAAFLMRRAAAYQAYFEHMPLPRRMAPTATGMRLYAQADFGAIARIHVLDDRQYRTPQACPRPGRGGGNVVAASECAELRAPGRTMLGQEQENWLLDGLARSSARWNLVAQQTLMTKVDRTPGAGQSFWTDGWDGYPESRERLLRFIAEKRVPNPLVIGGDVHMFVVADLKTDFDDPKAPAVATEFTGTSITSQGLSQKTLEAWREENPHVRFGNSLRRGYTTIELDAKRCLTRMRVVNEKDPQSPVSTLATWAVEDGKPGAQPD